MVNKLTKTSILGIYLNNYAKRYYLREAAVLLKKPHQTIKPYLERLVKEKVLVKTERKNIVEYSLNLKENITYDYLTIAEKEKLIQRLDKDTLLKILSEKLSSFFVKNTFLIFGSAVDELKKGSDIDLLVVGTQKVESIVKEFEKIYNKEIHLIKTTNLNKLSNTLIKEIYQKHLILNNTEQVIRFFGELYEKNKLV